MKKLAAFLLTLLMAVSLVACAVNSESAETSSPDVESSTSEDISSQESSTGNSKSDRKIVQTKETEEIENKTENDTEDDIENDTETDETKILVAYFSATNTTEGIAEYAADVLGADLYEIVPEEPYTDDDLNYNDDNSRTTIEMNDPSARPAISGSVENMEQYDIVLIGYPIWWGDAPRIISTFMESYDFSGKTIVPFCTSGSSGIGSSAANLEKLTDGAQWLAGKRLDGSSSRNEVEEWINSLGLDALAE